MSSNTKAFEDKMKSAVEHLERELKTVRAGRANPGVLDKVTVDYYGSPTPIQQVASVAVSEARTLTITPWDRSLLRAIIEMYNGGPVGLETLAAALGEEAVTLEDVYEPYLMQLGFLTRTPRGRCVTPWPMTTCTSPTRGRPSSRSKGRVLSHPYPFHQKLCAGIGKNA